MKPCVLLVDDDPSVTTAVGGVLLSEGYNVITARNGQEAIDKFWAHGQIDLVLLDLNMPVKSGWDTFEGLTALDPLVPVVLITARADQRRLSEAAGVGALMEKPLHIPRLLEVMKHLLAESPNDRLARISSQASRTLYSRSVSLPQLPSQKS